MTDEEKKAIERIEKLVEYLKKWNKNFTVVPEDVKYFEKILDMTKTHIRMIDENIEEILEQSKEIEELKAISEYREKIIKGLGLKTLPKTITGFRELIENNDKKWKDKIKAKIKELENKLEYETNGWESEYEYCKEVLQSLLEEE